MCIAEGVVWLSVAAKKAHLVFIPTHQPLHKTFCSSPLWCHTVSLYWVVSPAAFVVLLSVSPVTVAAIFCPQMGLCDHPYPCQPILQCSSIKCSASVFVLVLITLESSTSWPANPLPSQLALCLNISIKLSQISVSASGSKTHTHTHKITAIWPA